tara:strand:- start:175 stop:369 length:195 start_codon:yes stop_codon:yes gene_type:complete
MECILISFVLSLFDFILRIFPSLINTGNTYANVCITVSHITVELFVEGVDLLATKSSCMVNKLP